CLFCHSSATLWVLCGERPSSPTLIGGRPVIVAHPQIGAQVVEPLNRLAVIVRLEPAAQVGRYRAVDDHDIGGAGSVQLGELLALPGDARLAPGREDGAAPPEGGGGPRHPPPRQRAGAEEAGAPGRRSPPDAAPDAPRPA